MTGSSPPQDIMCVQLEDIEDDQGEEIRSGCLPCCSRHKHYNRSRVRVASSSLTPEEEGAFLLQCDHLSRNNIH